MSTDHAPDVIARYEAQFAAEIEAAEVGSEDPRDSVMALAATLAELASCLVSSVTGEPAVAATCHDEASKASGRAFPPGTSESGALGVLLDYAAGVMRRAS